LPTSALRRIAGEQHRPVDRTGWSESASVSLASHDAGAEIVTGPALSRSAFDRAVSRRKDAVWLHAAADRGRLLVVDEERRVLVDEGEQLVLVDAADHDGELVLLGIDENEVAVFAAAASLPRKLGARPATLRDVGASLPPTQAAWYVTAVALVNWHERHPRCPRCGEPTRMETGGWSRRCDRDGSEHFPRTDPAVIVLVHDGGERCLLGRQPAWPRGRYSTLAGFVEPGESLEQAVVREVEEEAGVIVDELRYRGSQPWPYPSSLMLGYWARAVGGEARVSDDELEDVRWFSRDELLDANALLPPPASIAHWLITTWRDQLE
jgi:NAD+ diphosphatase